MQSVRQVQRLNDLELQKVVPPNASWHTDYRDTAYIYIGGLPFELSEGDVLTIFSQYGNPVHINLVRDKETGKSKGFAFLKYEDQRSCDLAVDNLSGAGVMGRVISVDHTRYKKKEGEIETVGDETEDGDETDREGAARSKRRRTESESEEERPMIKEEVELAKLKNSMEDDDPMKAYMIQEKQAEVEDALKAVSLRKSKHKDRERRHKHKHHHRSRRDHSDDENDHKKDRHRSRRHREDDVDGERDGRRSRRSKTDRATGSDSEDGGAQRHSRRSRRDRTATPDSDDDRRRRRERSKRDDSLSDDRSRSSEHHRRR
ncbi:hypothetical protein KC331_g6892 [Hortaea werneckii]|uniref:RRM domain-containing protein n=1 Tax=Hortaea werneckii TaxID=91943 RepID=A0A3M7CTP8_HORWE|nr:hypothetical protein KC331_g6892 [Hortaea werneckii]KAI7722537.1 hypothetical protein KC353_g417 [Hortaea werneckii]RMY55312.1 hypothetical protein D0865_04249 [Hortaea werneckii]